MKKINKRKEDIEMPFFSIIIPARNESKYIAEAIKSLQKQTIQRDFYEIIVVDNNSTDDTGQVAKETGADKIILEREQGTNIARQAGINASDKKAKIMCFLDADSKAPSDWLEKIRKDLVESGSVAVSGPYDHGFVGVMKGLDYFYTHKVVPKVPDILHFIFRKKMGVMEGGNFAVFRWGIDLIGGLPPLKFYGDDATTAMLLARHAGRVLFDPELVVYSSPRRFQKGGVILNALKYAFMYFKAYFSKEYT